MKLKREYLDKEVRMTWRDASVSRIDCNGRENIPGGLATLPTFTEWGVLTSIKEGVAVIIHSESTKDPDLSGSSSNAYFITRVPEDLITEIRVLVEDGQREVSS